ncbi:uncharacterized protein BDZ99DRAFT_576593 [Mytilinidion resinicola]|uniref:Mid2 domain-containing protein n=1 Tax=Mytilinidion resinicola TaxID=574789 RepID=A0A6A6Y2F3_9PEZI|nr:uncharacterized protein BDZ99DRAFT_576593 [Mytilinidion resinicola]KAF2802693.1 hypothetical protein BDZ99DRAFT_576593 [Mytilinidion resinicola]
MAIISIRRLALLAVPLFFQLGSATQQCYNPDGSESSDLPCSSDDSYQTFCCSPGSQCILDPGPLCQTSNGYERGTCTVQDWSSGACPKFCLADSTDQTVDRCTAKVSNGNFCCGYDADDNACSCDTNNNTFPLYAYTSIKVAQSAAASTSLSSASSAASSASSVATTNSASAAIASASGSAASATASGTSSPTPSSTSSDSGMSTGAKIGVGVAVPLGVIAIGLLGFLAWRQRRKSNAAAKAVYPAELPPQGHQGYYDPPPNEVKYAHEGSVGYGGGGIPGSPHQPPSEMYAPPPGQQQAYEMEGSGRLGQGQKRAGELDGTQVNRGQ